MAKTKFVRVATEGATADGRKIERKDITDMAETYDRTTYGARINMEHIRGFSPTGDFKAYGDVLALKTAEVTLKIGGKDEKRLALYAQLDATDDLIEINKKKQKLYTSIEIQPNFANSGKAYFVGMAVTDSPASLGTEMLEFASKAAVNPFASRKQNPDNLIVAAEEFALELDVEAPAQTEARTAYSAMTDFFKGLTGITQTPPEKVDPAPPAQTAGDLPAAFATQLMTGLQKMADAIEAGNKASETRFTALETKITGFEKQLDTTPNQTYKARPTESGGAGRVLADC